MPKILHAILLKDWTAVVALLLARGNVSQTVTVLVLHGLKSVTPSKLSQFVAPRIRVQLPLSFENSTIRKLAKPNLG